MHHTNLLLGQIAAILAIVQVVPYIWSIFFGATRPSRASYGIWTALQVVLYFSYVSAGATTTRWTSLATMINCMLIFSLSLKYGMGGRSTIDTVSMSMAGAALAIWAVTGNAALTVYMCVFANIVGYMPTIRKAYHLPRTENTLSWSMALVSAIFNVLALTSDKPAIALPPLVSLGLVGIVTGLLVAPRPLLPDADSLDASSWSFSSIFARFYE